MRITHAVLQNCRVHSYLRHEFSPGLNLIGGDNESGKSTIVEAIHRALFLKAKGASAHHKALVPTSGGAPEVELGIEANGRRFVLRKRFGSNGSTTFAPQDAAQQIGPEAEAALETIVGPSASGQQLEERWAHLWVWQGESSNDPTSHATAQRDQLLARLQQLGGAAILQSESDTRLAQHFADEANRWFVSAGRPRTDSSLGRANKEVETAEQQLRAAEARWNRLESAYQDHEAATRATSQATSALAALQSEEMRCANKQQELAELRTKETAETNRRNTAETTLKSAQATEQRIREISTEIQSLETEGTQRNRQLSEVRTVAQAAREALSRAEEHLTTAELVAQRSLCMRDVAATQVETLEISEQQDRLRSLVEKAEALRKEISAKESALATLPAITPQTLRKLQKKDTDLGEAKASVRAMATGLTLVDSNVPIRAGFETLTSGQSTILTQETLVAVGEHVRLRIQPGGGATLEETRTRARDLEADLQDDLRVLVLRSVAEAEESLNKRRDLEHDLAGLKGRSQELGRESLVEKSADLETRLAKAKALLGRLVELTGENLPIRNLEEARSHYSRLKSDHEVLEGTVRGARTSRDEAKEKREDCDRHERELGELDQSKRSKLDGLRGQVELLVRDHGDETIRAHRLEQARTDLTVAETGLRETQEAIDRLQPDLLTADKERLQRVRSEQTNLLAQSREKTATARGVLIADGVHDPAADLSAARRRKEQALEQARAQRLHGSAIALLDRLFQQEQQNLSSQFTRPLADRLNGYLRCLFGPRAEAQVDLTEGEFQGLRLLRPDEGPSPLPFDALSGGAREQVGAALRLAVAELLASGGDGTLPVVFDDAFAFSDPDRVHGMHRMLDRAARQGLQILVMTCNPTNYTSLGAQQLMLNRVRSPIAQVPSRTTLEETSPTLTVSGDNHNAAPGSATAPEYASANPATPVDEARFLDALGSLGGSSGNQLLRKTLGWSEVDYETVRSSLIASGRLIPGRGRGGTVALANT